MKGALPAVMAALSKLTTAELKAFGAAGSMEVAGHVLTTEEVLLARVFKGETTTYDACASPSGNLVVVLNHVVTDELRVMVRWLDCCQLARTHIHMHTHMHLSVVLSLSRPRPHGCPHPVAGCGCCVVGWVRNVARRHDCPAPPPFFHCIPPAPPPPFPFVVGVRVCRACRVN